MTKSKTQAPAPTGEHEVEETFTESEFYKNHASPRKESKTFIKTKKDGAKRGDRCAVCGTAAGLEYHHVFVEWAYMDAVDWATMKGLALGTVKQLPVRDPATLLPTGEMADAAHFYCYFVVKFTEMRGFDWAAFDPAKPESFVDGPQNMMVLNERFHRAKNHGIHCRTFPTWSVQGFPLVDGFVLSPDQLATHGDPAKGA